MWNPAKPAKPTFPDSLLYLYMYVCVGAFPLQTIKLHSLPSNLLAFFLSLLLSRDLNIHSALLTTPVSSDVRHGNLQDYEHQLIETRLIQCLGAIA